MPIDRVQAGKSAAGSGDGAVSGPMPRRAVEVDWTARVWRPAGTLVAVALALLLGWHVVNGRNGISVWLEKRIEERQLRKENNDLQKENERLRDRNERLKSDPDAIEMVARDQLHYVKPNEVIVPPPALPQSQAQPAGAGK
jgi:cell division protein FtsB